MIFVKCPSMAGQCILHQEPLRIDVYRDVTFEHHSIYDASGLMVRDSGYFRAFPTFECLSGPQRVGLSGDAALMSEGDYFWLGRIFTHYGHFIVATLSRLWAWDRHAGPATRLIYVGEHDPEDLFRIDYIKLCFEALGIRQEQLVRLSAPTRFQTLAIAEPAFVENFAVSPAYHRVTSLIGRKLLAGAPQRKSRNSRIYLSRSRLQSGSWTVSNERELEEHLEREGVRTVHPEQMGLIEQLQLMSQASCVVGFSGSAFHTSAFLEGVRSCVISHHVLASSNHALIDLVSGGRGLFIYPGQSSDIDQTDRNGFARTVTIKDVGWMAREIVSTIDRFERGRIRQQLVPIRRLPIADGEAAISSFGRRLVEDGIVERSKIDSGTTRFQLTLPRHCFLNELVIRGASRSDELARHAVSASIFVSGNGRDWTSVSDDIPVREVVVDDRPALIWRTPGATLARLVRVDVATTRTDALDVDVYGDVASRFDVGLVVSTRRQIRPRLIPFAAVRAAFAARDRIRRWFETNSA